MDGGRARGLLKGLLGVARRGDKREQPVRGRISQKTCGHFHDERCETFVRNGHVSMGSNGELAVGRYEGTFHTSITNGIHLSEIHVSNIWESSRVDYRRAGGLLWRLQYDRVVRKGRRNGTLRTPSTRHPATPCKICRIYSKESLFRRHLAVLDFPRCCSWACF